MFKITAYEKNSIIHLEGDICEKLEIIISGQVVIDRIDSSGNLLTISEFSGGDILGGNLMFSSKPHYLMSVSASEKSTLLEIPASLVFELLNSNKVFLMAYLEYISDITAILGNKIKSYAKKTLRESIIYYLKQEYKNQGTRAISLSITKKKLAESFGVERTSLSRELKKMQNDNLITFDNKSITITDTRLIK